MALANSLTDKEHAKFRDNAGGAAIAIVNPDGSNVTPSGGGGTSMVDKAAMVEAGSSYTPAGGVFNDSLAAVSSGTGAWFRITAFRGIHSNLRDASGNEIASGTSNTDTGQRALYVRNLGAGGGGSAPSGTTGSAIPTTISPIGGSDGTNLQPMRLFDADSGAGTQWVQGISLRKAASGGSVELGTSSDPIRTDPTGTTAQPVTDNGGSITVDGTVGISGNVDVTPASPAANDYLPVRLTDGSAFYSAGGGGGGTSSNFGSADPAAGTAAGFSDGTNMREARVFDTDSGAGAEYTVGVSLRKAASGGSVELGTSSDPVRVDPTGTTTQPISAASLPLPSGASTETTLSSVNTAIGAPGDAVYTTGSGSLVAISKGIFNRVTGVSSAKVPVDLINIATKLANQVVSATDQALVVGISPNSPLNGIKQWSNLGFFSVFGATGTYSGLAANTPLYSFRWTDAAKLAVILTVELTVVTSVAASAAGITERQLILARSFTVSDTGGTALTPTASSNNQKHRTSMSASVVGDIRAGNPLTAGTRTLDTNPINSLIGWSALNHTGPILGGHGAAATAAAWSTAGAEPFRLWDAANPTMYPIVLAQNEGFIIRVGAVMPTGATQQTFVRVTWAEVNSY